MNKKNSPYQKFKNLVKIKISDQKMYSYRCPIPVLLDTVQYSINIEYIYKVVMSQWFFFTTNFKSIEDPADLPMLEWDELEEKCDFLRYSVERGKDGVLHFQGVLHTFGKHQITGVKKFPGFKRSHVEVMRRAGALEYVQKEETHVSGPYNFGKMPADSGERTDMAELFGILEKGGTILDVAKKNPETWARYHKAFDRYRSLIEQNEFTTYSGQFVLPRPEGFDKKAHLIYGPTGIGKSSWGASWFKHPAWINAIEDLRDIPADTDGLVFDDIDFTKIDFSTCKNILDMTRTGTLNARYSNIKIKKGMPRVFSWNYDNLFMLNKSPEHINALDRLIVKIGVENKLYIE